ncbi:MAG TPA: bifunctional protein-serine/threonine kinase/phosphatase [Pseudomonadales bacterium]
MATAKTLSLAYGGHTTAGVKERNEDAFGMLLPASQLRFSKGAIAAIADGVSCSDNAQVASRTSVATFIQDYLSTPETWDVKTSASRVLAALNSWLYYQGQSSLTRQNGFVTTFSSVIFRSTTAHVLHCGDSRVYRFRDGRLQQLTSDHCLAQAGGDLTLTRALGMDTELKVDYQQRSLRVGDLLLFTTDGVHGSLKHAEIGEVLAALAAPAAAAGEGGNSSLEQAARQLIERALQGGSSDNLSCLLVRVLDLPVENIDEAHNKLTQLVIPPVLAPGHKLDGYTVVKTLHSGSRSHLYLATHPRYRQKFVLKAPSQNFADDPQYLEGFMREQWVGRRIDHPGIMKIHDAVPDSKFLYHICEYVEGTTLRQWMYDNPRPDLAQVRELAKQIAASLRVLQRLGMLHRDLKPDNIMLTRNGDVKLIDFGTVQVSGLQDIHSPLREDIPVGTADYMAPEYLLGERGEYRSDIFSFGVIVYELLTGVLPYKPIPTDTSRIRSYDRWRYRSALDVRKELPLWFDLALRKACAPRPSQRYAALSEFLHDLDVPNQQLLAAEQHKPLIEKNPVRFWQGVSLVLFVLLVVQAVFT